MVYMVYNIYTVYTVYNIQYMKIAKFVIDFDLRRNQPFYSLTLFIPILVLTLLSPIGLLLPGELYSVKTIVSVIHGV